MGELGPAQPGCCCPRDPGIMTDAVITRPVEAQRKGASLAQSATKVLQQAGAFNFWRDLYFFVVRKWTNTYQCKNCYLPSRCQVFYTDITSPHNTGNENLLCLSVRHCIFKSSANRLAYPARSPSPVNRKENFCGLRIEKFQGFGFSSPDLDFRDNRRAPSVRFRERGWLGEG